ncbi:lipopolysaccharide biosynthesis protein [Arenibacter algicola]|uniref:lipopolysaccharide biosynthesis protein n=1 Tax=Arenibacter algicola TaxID=616991 RepID=UPI0004DF2D74|nr:MATE family efflux transporter [Arenibacter algicola]
MKFSLSNIAANLGITSGRTKNIVKHIGWSLFYKIGSIIANFLLVPLTINYLDTENYGIWLTLSSFISWFSFFDIGLGNGLRNKFAEAKTLGNYKDAQAFVSTAYFTIGTISMFLFLVLILINPLINWAALFNTQEILQDELSLLLPIIFGFFALQLVVKLITSIYQADQNHSIQGKIQFFGQVLLLLVIFLLTKTDQSSLLIFGSIFSALPVLILIGLNFFAFNTTFKAFKPKFSLWKQEYLKEITGLGFKFFVVQIAVMVLFSTDNFIISRLFGPEEVVPYNVAFKYFSIVTMAYTIIITPYWSSFTEAYAKKDFEWIKKSVSNIQKIWLSIPVGLVGMIFLADWFYEFWVGDKVKVSMQLSLAMAFFVVLLTFNMIYVNFINGVGKIKLQLITSLISMSINIPLSIYLGKYLGWGSTGVILATCFSLGYSLILRPIQYYKLINNTAKGIWNK